MDSAIEDRSSLITEGLASLSTALLDTVKGLEKQLNAHGTKPKVIASARSVVETEIDQMQEIQNIRLQLDAALSLRWYRKLGIQEPSEAELTSAARFFANLDAAETEAWYRTLDRLKDHWNTWQVDWPGEEVMGWIVYRLGFFSFVGLEDFQQHRRWDDPTLQLTDFINVVCLENDGKDPVVEAITPVIYMDNEIKSLEEAKLSNSKIVQDRKPATWSRTTKKMDADIADAEATFSTAELSTLKIHSTYSGQSDNAHSRLNGILCEAYRLSRPGQEEFLGKAKSLLVIRIAHAFQQDLSISKNQMFERIRNVVIARGFDSSVFQDYAEIATIFLLLCFWETNIEIGGAYPPGALKEEFRNCGSSLNNPHQSNAILGSMPSLRGEGNLRRNINVMLASTGVPDLPLPLLQDPQFLDLWPQYRSNQFPMRLSNKDGLKDIPEIKAEVVALAADLLAKSDSVLLSCYLVLLGFLTILRDCGQDIGPLGLPHDLERGKPHTIILNAPRLGARRYFTFTWIDDPGSCIYASTALKIAKRQFTSISLVSHYMQAVQTRDTNAAHMKSLKMSAGV